MTHNPEANGASSLVATDKAVAADKAAVPVRVRLKRISCDQARPYPPDGQGREWWDRLRSVFGTASSPFVEASLQQLIAAAKLPGSGISETAVKRQLGLHRRSKAQR